MLCVAVPRQGRHVRLRHASGTLGCATLMVCDASHFCGTSCNARTGRRQAAGLSDVTANRWSQHNSTLCYWNTAGHASLPLLDDEADLAGIDVALITHFHLDHCAAVVYLVARTAFQGLIFMTHATKSIFYTMMKDIIRMHKNFPSRQLFTAAQLEKTMAKITVINFHQTVDVAGMQITPYRCVTTPAVRGQHAPALQVAWLMRSVGVRVGSARRAGHVLGAAMFMVEIKGMRCLYTGDYSRVPDRHMPAADLPGVPPDIVIVESTFGVSNHLPRADRERTFQNKARCRLNTRCVHHMWGPRVSETATVGAGAGYCGPGWTVLDPGRGTRARAGAAPHP